MSRWLSPVGILLVTFCFFTARWIWIAGVGDYGWAYETGTRVLQGQVPYRDFVSTLPQLTSYTIVPFLVLLRGSLWAWSVHLYLWWLISLLAGLKVLIELGASRKVQSAGMFLAVCLSFPAATDSHAYNYAATAFMALTFLCVLKFRRTPRASLAAWTGFCAGLALMAKQNIGGISVLLAGLSILHACVAAGRRPILLMSLFSFGFAVTIAVAPMLLYWMAMSSPAEVFYQMFLDASKAKGGALKMLLHAMPILYLERSSPFSLLWIALISAATFGCFFLLFVRSINKCERVEAFSSDQTRETATLWIGLALVMALSLASLASFPAIKPALDFIHTPFGCGGFNILVFVLYSSITSFGAVLLGRALVRGSTETVMPCVWLIAMVCGHATSLMFYLPFAAPVAAPLMLYLLHHTCRFNVQTLAAVIASLAVLLLILVPSREYPPVFEQLYTLPARTPFGGLRAVKRYADDVKLLHDNVSPRIQGKTTLWLCLGGPYLAFGGKPTHDIALLNFDTYGKRLEAPLINRWTALPPDFVVHRPFIPCRGSQFFTEEYLQAWFPTVFDLIWTDPYSQTSLWKRK